MASFVLTFLNWLTHMLSLEQPLPGLLIYKEI